MHFSNKNEIFWKLLSKKVLAKQKMRNRSTFLAHSIYSKDVSISGESNYMENEALCTKFMVYTYLYVCKCLWVLALHYINMYVGIIIINMNTDFYGMPFDTRLLNNKTYFLLRKVIYNRYFLRNSKRMRTYQISFIWKKI